MFIVNMQVSFNLPYVNGLKGRRKIINSIKDRLRRQNLSTLDISGEYVKEAELAICFLAIDQKAISQKIQTIESILYRGSEEFEFEIDYEVI
jgi:uncharacterized protein YlxP (DUF503 family)